MTNKPTFLLIPGAWHTPVAYKLLADTLHGRGYKTTSVSLSTVGTSSPRKLPDADAASIKEAIAAELDSGSDVIVVSHSYSSIPKAEALKSFINTPGGKGKVKRIVYMCSFVLPEGGSLMAALGGKDLPWFNVQGDVVNPDNPAHVFYNDLSESEAKPYIEALQPFSYRSFYHEQSFAPQNHFPSTYILCELDNAIPLAIQEGMVAGAQAGAPQSFDVVERCAASHSPFLSVPEQVADFLVKAAES